MGGRLGGFMRIEARPSPTFCPTLFMHILRHVAYIYEHIWTIGDISPRFSNCHLTTKALNAHIWTHGCTKLPHTHIAPSRWSSRCSQRRWHVCPLTFGGTLRPLPLLGGAFYRSSDPQKAIKLWSWIALFANSQDIWWNSQWSKGALDRSPSASKKRPK